MGLLNKSLLAAMLATISVACTTTAPGPAASRDTTAPPPPIYANMPLDKAVQAGIDFGGDTLTSVKKLIKRRNQGIEAAKLIRELLHENLQKYDHTQLIDAGHLYTAMPVAFEPEVFRDLLGSGRPLAQQLGWQLAAVKPSPALAKAIDNELTRALAEGDDDAVLVPQMANAVRANHLKSAYTLMRIGLMAKGDEEFAQAMMTLDPKRAANDFLLYLAIPPAEELRQLSLSSINLYTAMGILRHMQSNPPTPGAADFDHLFYFAVSRNLVLAEQAQVVLEQFIPEYTELLAAGLARLPAWVQIAYLDAARRRMNPKEGILLSELKKDTSESDVVQEINEIRF